MKNSPILFALLLVLVPSHGGLSGQGSRLRELQRPDFPKPVLQLDSTAFAAPSWNRRILTGLAGAVLGAGLGYFASQVVMGDWEQREGRGGVHRPTWTAVGGAGGMMLGFSFPVLHRSRGSPRPAVIEDPRFVITGEEIREALVRNALNAVRYFHPEWLVLRGRQSVANPDSDGIRTYLDNVQLGGVDALINVDAQMIDLIRFYDARQATLRWGMSHTHGAIQVVTLGGG